MRKMPTIRAIGQYLNMVTDKFGYQGYKPCNITQTKPSCPPNR